MITEMGEISQTQKILYIPVKSVEKYKNILTKP